MTTRPSGSPPNHPRTTGRKLRFRLSAALLLLAAALAAPGLKAQELCAGFPVENRLTRLGGTHTSFAEGTYIDSVATLQALFVKYEADIRAVFAERGLGQVGDALLAQVASGEGIREGSVEPGSDFQWIAWRRQGTPTVTAPVCMATTQSYESFLIDVPVTSGEQHSVYTFSMPKICMNIALAGVETTAVPMAAAAAPAPTCTVSAVPAEAAVGRPVTIQVSGADGPYTVRIEGPDGAMVEELHEPFPRTTRFDRSGSYRVRALATSAAGDSVECATTLVVVVDQARWTVRPYVVGFFPHNQRVTGNIENDHSPPDDHPARVTYHSDMGPGFGIEYQWNDRFGIEFRAVWARPEATLNVGAETDGEDIWYRSFTIGPNFHFRRSPRADWFAGPYIGVAKLEDPTLLTPSGASFETDFDSEPVYGVQAGVDVALRQNSPWRFHASIMQSYVEFEDDTTGLKLDANPTQVLIGAAYRF